MKRLLPTLLLLALPCLADAFEDLTTAVSASQYQQQILISYPRQDAAASAATLAKAERYAQQKLWREAIAEYEAAIAGGAGRPGVWLSLSRVWRDHDQADNRWDRARQAAFNAYRAAGTPREQAQALFALGELYDQQQQPKQAIAAFKEGLGLEDNVRIARRYQELVESAAFQVKDVEVESDSAAPRVCLRFSDNLVKGRQVHYEDYVVIEPPIQAVVSAQEQQLCIAGVSHGQSYQITLRAGVPAASGEKTARAESFTAQVANREPSLGFRGNAYVLPRIGGQELPLRSVNVNAARLRLLRINDRNLTEQINDRRISASLDDYDIRSIAKRSGEVVWEGELAIPSELNQEATTAIAVGEILKNTQPGIYVLTAEPAEQSTDDYENRATQWLVVSDLGLATLQGEDGLHVFVRSLDTARPRAGVELRLYARNNSELGQASTDRSGYARFDPGLLRGAGGREPAALMAYGDGGDFNFLDLTRPAFDLSDRGVAGRPAPGPIDAFLYSDRGVYRPGETVELMALVRDSQGYARDSLPLTLKVIRPDEVELAQITLTGDQVGGHHARIPLADNARTGVWTVRAYADPKARPVGELTFQVEDFVPQQLKLELTTAATLLEPGRPVDVEVNGQFLYGAPAANLPAKAEVTLREDPEPYPQHSGFRFGLAQESWTPKRYPADLAGTDAQGHAQVSLRLEETPEVSRPLQAVLRVSLFEPGGRPVNRLLSLPYRTQPFAIGIRPLFDDEGIPLGQDAAFQVIAVDPRGERMAVTGLRYELFREDYDYYWYNTGERWDYKRVVRDSQPLEARDLKLAPGEPFTLRKGGLDWGHYRVEIYDSNTGVATSVRFQVGWFATPGEEDSPDQLRVTLDKPRYQIGETARVHIQGAFAGEALLLAGSDRLWSRQTLSVTADGATLELPVSADWGPGVYLTAVAFRPAQNAARRGPGRAIGVTWLEVDPQPRTLAVRLEAPAEWRPRQTVDLPVTVTDAESGQAVYLTVAAVDEGILQLTDFPSPDPVSYFLGKRRLGLDIRDLYGRLIETGGRPGQLRSGGDAESRQLKGPGVRTRQTVALFSGPVPVDASGQARIPLALPDFNGQLRLMAVAWDRRRLGKAEAPLLVRDPLVVQVYLPRFLAPEDVSRITVTVQNLSAPAGDYRVRLTATGAVGLDEAAEFSFAVRDAATSVTESRRVALRGLTPGVGQLRLQVNGPDGFSLTHDWEIAVRPAQPIATERYALRLPPGESLLIRDDLLNGYLADTGELRLSFASRPNLNVPGLLAQLVRYPYGCAEQTISAALPLLYFNQVARVWAGEQATEAGLRNRVQEAIGRLLTMQRSDGGFGLWNPDSPAGDWLSAYAMDFLTRAREHGYLVPAMPLQAGLKHLKESLGATEPDANTLAAQVYALYVLARVEQAPIGELRYRHDNSLKSLPTALAQAQLGAALARYGESARAQEAFAAALANVPASPGRRDYGSPLRDRAAVLALLAEAGLLPERKAPLAEELAAEFNQRLYASTQEQAWLLLAAHALLQEPGRLLLSVDGQAVPPEADPYYLKPDGTALEQGLTIVNSGGQPVWYVVNVSGVPVQDQPPAQQGFAIARRFYTRTGQEVDLSQVRQNDLLVAVITGEARTQENHQALIVDLLPAGLEIENARLGQAESAEEIRWLPRLSETLHTELRDDRFVAALDLSEDQRRFTVAYLARAVTPGDYRLPAVFIEDMYKPWYFGRGALGVLEVQ